MAGLMDHGSREKMPKPRLVVAVTLANSTAPIARGAFAPSEKSDERRNIAYDG